MHAHGGGLCASLVRAMLRTRTLMGSSLRGCVRRSATCCGTHLQAACGGGEYGANYVQCICMNAHYATHAHIIGARHCARPHGPRVAAACTCARWRGQRSSDRMRAPSRADGVATLASASLFIRCPPAHTHHNHNHRTNTNSTTRVALAVVQPVVGSRAWLLVYPCADSCHHIRVHAGPHTQCHSAGHHRWHIRRLPPPRWLRLWRIL